MYFVYLDTNRPSAFVQPGDFSMVTTWCAKGFLHSSVRLLNDLYCVEWDVKPYYTIPAQFCNEIFWLARCSSWCQAKCVKELRANNSVRLTLKFHLTLTKVANVIYQARWPSSWDAGLADNRSWDQFLASQLSSATLGKLLTHTCLCHQAA